MHYKIFGTHTGLRVSEFALGTALFGTRWGYGTELAESRKVFSAYAEAGGNFLDTSDVYQFGESEEFIGQLIGAERDQFVIATKYTGGSGPNLGVSRSGNSRKNMVQSVEASLKRLGTDRIDLYWVHYPDGVTPMDEIVRGLDDLVSAGKILYAGFSDFPAWRIARAATVAELRGWAPIVGLQTEYSLVERTPERDLLPMARAFGLGTVAWSPLGGGFLTGKYRKGETGRLTGLKSTIHEEDHTQKSKVLDVVLAIAEELRIAPSHVALAWVRAQGVITIIGPRTVEQLQDNLGALKVELSEEHLRRLSEVSAVALGFPHDFIAKDDVRKASTGGQADLVDFPTSPLL